MEALVVLYQLPRKKSQLEITSWLILHSCSFAHGREPVLRCVRRLLIISQDIVSGNNHIERDATNNILLFVPVWCSCAQNIDDVFQLTFPASGLISTARLIVIDAYVGDLG